MSSPVIAVLCDRAPRRAAEPGGCVVPSPRSFSLSAVRHRAGARGHASLVICLSLSVSPSARARRRGPGGAPTPRWCTAICVAGATRPPHHSQTARHVFRAGQPLCAVAPRADTGTRDAGHTPQMYDMQTVPNTDDTNTSRSAHCGESGMVIKILHGLIWKSTSTDSRHLHLSVRSARLRNRGTGLARRLWD